VRIDLPSRLELLSVVNAVSEEVCDQIELDEESRDSVATSVIEAATNAIEHGNGLDPSKRVVVRFDSDGSRLTVTVTDEGDGFDPASLEDPLAPGNILRERGRGIFILRQFMDEVSFHHREEGGMKVVLVKEFGESEPQERKAAKS
jgi:serine/threonine-protein kinase RsbW